MASFGIDVSEWQGTIDWSKVAAAGVDFAFIRAGYGEDRPDRKFAENWAGAKAAGIARGGYLWFRPSRDPLAQSAFLAERCGDGELVPWCDFETAERLAPQLALAQLDRHLGDLEGRLGTTPVLYTGPAFWRSMGTVWPPVLTAARYPLAIAHYTAAPKPDVPAPWTSWAYWQHSSAGHVPGIGGPVDTDWAAVLPLLTAAGRSPEEHPMAHLNAPIVEIIATPTGKGYWQIAGDGGVFAWGDAVAPADNPLPAMRLSAPIVGGTVTPDGRNLILTGADGGVFPLGPDAAQLQLGSIPALP